MSKSRPICPTESLGVRAVSFVIAAILILQVAGAFDLYPRLVSRPSHRFWPFLDYPMYRYAHYEGDLIHWHRVFGRRSDGTEVEVSPGDLGLNWRKFRDVFVFAIRRGDVATVTTFAKVYRLRGGARLVALRVEQHGYALTRDGLRPAVPHQLAAVPLDAQ